jgi:hypothetical protein
MSPRTAKRCQNLQAVARNYLPTKKKKKRTDRFSNCQMLQATNVKYWEKLPLDDGTYFVTFRTATIYYLPHHH